MHVDFSLDRIKECAKNITLINSKYRLFSSNEIFNQFTYESFEFLSLGVYIDINLNSVSDNKTEISIEIRRKIGTFNESHEVTHANDHIVNIVNYLSQLTFISPEQISLLKVKEQKAVPVIIKSKKDKNTATILAFFPWRDRYTQILPGTNRNGNCLHIILLDFYSCMHCLYRFLCIHLYFTNKFDLKYNR